MGLPGHLLPHDVTVVHPVSTADPAYGPVYDYGAGATRTTVRGWLQQNDATEVFSDTRDEFVQRWLLVTNYATIDGNDRVEWAGHPAGGTVIFTVDGPPEPAYTPRGYDHLEVPLRMVEG